MLLFDIAHGDSTKNIICPICKSLISFYVPFSSSYCSIPRPKAMCPVCRCLERHRLLWIYLMEYNCFKNIETSVIRILHVAPEKSIFDLLYGKENIEYYPIDIEIENYPKGTIYMDVMKLEFPDEFFDIIICNNVTSNVQDDLIAHKGFYRVLKKDGIAFINNAINHNISATFENKEYNTPELRKKNYGHPLFWRVYGNDYVERLSLCGFNVKRIIPSDFLSDDDIERYSLDAELYVCKKV